MASMVERRPQTHAGNAVVTLKTADREPFVRLVCLPYAAGGTGLFRSWAGQLGPHVELLSVVLPGRGSRIGEPPYEHWDELVADVFAELSPYLSVPHAFYGHSFGGRVAYELARRAMTEADGPTRHLFVSGCRCPSSPQARPYLHELSDVEFVAALRDTYGVPAKLVDDDVTLRLLLPALRSDIRLAERWGEERWGEEYPGAAPLTMPITAIYGRDDLIDNWSSMWCWAAYSTVGCELIEIPGGHFVGEVNGGRLLEIIMLRLGSASSWR